MTDESMREADSLSGVSVRAAEAAAALEALQAPAERAASAIEAAFGRAGESLTRSLARAAADGGISLGELARAVLAAVNAVMGAGGGSSPSGVRDGLGAAVAQAVGGLFSGTFGGARADGGLVTSGSAYLVGERGPEVFRPAASGTVEPMNAAPVTVHLNLASGPESLLRSEAQIAQMLARAVALGARRL